jgi:hypothetical protein
VRLNRLHDLYAAKGFQLVVISPHALSDLREQLIGKYGAKYWIGCDSKLKTLIGFIVPNTRAEFPMSYLVDSRGKIVDPGPELEEKIQYLLDEVFDPSLRRELAPGLADARAAYEAGSVGAAWLAAAPALESADASLVADAKFLRERCEAYGAWKRLMLERKISEGALPAAVRALKEVEKAFAGMPVSAWAGETRRDLEKDPKVKMESVLGVPFRPGIGRELHAGLKSARRNYDRDAIGAAWKMAGLKLDDEDAELAADAAFLRERCEAYAEYKRYELQRDIDNGRFPPAVEGLQELSRTCKGMPTAAWATETRRALREDPKVKRELKAWTRLQRALAKAERARGNPKKMRPVRRELESIRESYPDTLAAREAARELRR